MLNLLAVIAAATSAPQSVPATPSSCTRFLTGHWIGNGVVTGFGKPVKVSNDYRFKGDGTFTTVNKYLGSNGKWTTQTLTGRWSAGTGTGSGKCTLSLEGSGASAGSSSRSTLTMVNPDTFRSLGFDMKRVPG